jgi:putative transcriptional regulator
MDRGEDGAKTVEVLLKEAGFTVSEMCYSRPSCFDFAARKDTKLVLVKAQPDIDNLSLSDSVELKDICRSLSAASVMISARSREKPLEDDTVYSRYSVSTLTLRTLENIVLHGTYPLVQAGPGGYYVRIDGNAIRRRRQQLGQSVGKMAEMVGISRRTLYGYERGMAKPSVAAAYNLVYTLGIPVAKPVNVFEKPSREHKCFLFTTARRIVAKNKLLMKILGKFDRYGITTVRKAPFDFVIALPEDGTRILGGVAGRKDVHLNRRVDEILSVSKVIQAHPILVTDQQRLSNKNIPCLHSDDLLEIRSPKDLISSITSA